MCNSKVSSARHLPWQLRAPIGWGTVQSRRSPGSNEVFAFDAQGIGNAINIIEIADNLCGIVNSDIVQAGFTQGLYVRLRHLSWLGRQLFRISAKRAIDGIKRRCPPIARDGGYKRVRFGFGFESLDLGTEVVRM